jgi:hypothetical protein
VSGNRFKKIAAEVYDRVMAESGGRCNIEDIRDALLTEVLAQGITDDIVDEFVAGLLSAEDNRRSSDSGDEQLDLFSGDPAAYDTVWRVGAGDRVQVKYATRVDWQARIGLKVQNVDRVRSALAREQKRQAQLWPYLVDDTVTIPQAIAAWQTDNP